MRSFSRRRARLPQHHGRRARLGALLALAAVLWDIDARAASVRGAVRRASGVALELAGVEAAGQPSSPVEDGQKVFVQLGCQTCHDQPGTGPAPGRGPSLAGLAGSRVELLGGAAVTADDDYLRESILRPQAKVTKGYPPIMPSYDGLLSEDQLRQLIAYIRSLAPARQSE